MTDFASRKASRPRPPKADKPARVSEINGVPVPPELYAPKHQVWTNTAAHKRFMAARGWGLLARDRMPNDLPAGEATAINRRVQAAAQFAMQVGLVKRHGAQGVPHPDYNELSRLGLMVSREGMRARQAEINGRSEAL